MANSNPTSSSLSTSSPPSTVYPKLVVFDLDWTLWPLDVDTHVDPPFKRTLTVVKDCRNRSVELFPDTRRVLQELQGNKVPIAFASRTTDPTAAEALLKTFLLHEDSSIKQNNMSEQTLWDCLASRDHFQAYPSRGGRAKTNHFSEIMKAHSTHFNETIDFSDILFFDDADDNIEIALESGIIAIYLERGEGITYDLFKDGLKQWRSRTIS
jgi:magnesium-dependent phosphatase 1